MTSSFERDPFSLKPSWAVAIAYLSPRGYPLDQRNHSHEYPIPSPLHSIFRIPKSNVSFAFFLLCLPYILYFPVIDLYILHSFPCPILTMFYAFFCAAFLFLFFFLVSLFFVFLPLFFCLFYVFLLFFFLSLYFLYSLSLIVSARRRDHQQRGFFQSRSNGTSFLALVGPYHSPLFCPYRKSFSPYSKLFT